MYEVTVLKVWMLLRISNTSDTCINKNIIEKKVEKGILQNT